MAGQRDLEADAERGAGQDAGDRLAALVALVHARAFDLSQDGVDGHDALEDAGGGIVTAIVAHLCDHVEIHAAGEAAGLAAGDDDALDRVVGERVVDQPVELVEALDAHHVHRFARRVPGDGGDALGVGGDGEMLRHVFASPYTRSMIVAAPMPDATQSVARPVPLPLRSSSSSSVPMMMAPVAPSGCPSAMAPPFTLTLE